MPIVMSDGTVHETEFDMALKEGLSKWDDGPTTEQQMYDAADGRYSARDFKDVEQGMETQLNEHLWNRFEREGAGQPPIQEIGMKIGGHETPSMVPRATPGVPDQLSHGSAGGVLGREPQFSDGPIFQRGLAEYRRALDSPRGEPGSLERSGSNTFNREVRRSPADQTFRSMQEFHDWLGGGSDFTALSPGTARRAETTAMAREAAEHYSPDTNFQPHYPNPRGWESVEGGATGGRNTSVTGRQFNSIPFTTASGKEGEVAYTYYPATKNIHVNWMGAAVSGKDWASGQIKPHELGTDKVSEVLKELVTRHPEAQTISAMRVSGARAKVNGVGGVIKRPIPWDLIYPNGRPNAEAAE